MATGLPLACCQRGHQHQPKLDKWHAGTAHQQIVHPTSELTSSNEVPSWAKSLVYPRANQDLKTNLWCQTRGISTQPAVQKCLTGFVCDLQVKKPLTCKCYILWQWVSMLRYHFENRRHRAVYRKNMDLYGDITVLFPLFSIPFLTLFYLLTVSKSVTTQISFFTDRNYSM